MTEDEKIERYIRTAGPRLIASGFYDLNGAIEALGTLLHVHWLDRADEMKARIPELLRTVQVSGPSEPWRRLSEAFDDLNRQSIVARQHLGEDMSEGGGLIDEEMEKILAAGGTVSGYAFHHQQDTARAAIEGDLYLAFGCHAPPDGSGPDIMDPDGVEKMIAWMQERARRFRPQKQKIGKAIAACLEKHGCSVQWDGDPDERIRVVLFER